MGDVHHTSHCFVLQHIGGTYPERYYPSLSESLDHAKFAVITAAQEDGRFPVKQSFAACAHSGRLRYFELLAQTAGSQAFQVLCDMGQAGFDYDPVSHQNNCQLFPEGAGTVVIDGHDGKVTRIFPRPPIRRETDDTQHCQPIIFSSDGRLELARLQAIFQETTLISLEPMFIEIVNVGMRFRREVLQTLRERDSAMRGESRG